MIWGGSFLFPSKISKAALPDLFPFLAKERAFCVLTWQFLGPFVNLLTTRGKSAGARGLSGPRITISVLPDVGSCGRPMRVRLCEVLSTVVANYFPERAGGCWWWGCDNSFPLFYSFVISSDHFPPLCFVGNRVSRRIYRWVWGKVVVREPENFLLTMLSWTCSALLNVTLLGLGVVK